MGRDRERNKDKEQEKNEKKYWGGSAGDWRDEILLLWSQVKRQKRKVEGLEIKGNRIKVSKKTIEQIADRKGDNDYFNTEKYWNKTLCVAALKTNGFRRKWCSCLSACQ